MAKIFCTFLHNYNKTRVNAGACGVGVIYCFYKGQAQGSPRHCRRPFLMQAIDLRQKWQNWHLPAARPTGVGGTGKDTGGTGALLLSRRRDSALATN
jgi:hypothetical protein